MKITIVSRLFTMLVIVICTSLLVVESGYAQNRDLDKEKFKQKPPKALFEKADKAVLSSSAQEAFTQLSKSKKTKKLDVVRLPEALYNETTLTFEVDARTGSLMFGKGSGTEVTVVRNDLQVLSDDEIAWSGTIMYGLNEEVGDVTLIQNREGAVTGTIDLEGTFYEIRPLGTSNMHAVRQVDTGYMKDLYRENDVGTGKNKEVGFNQMNVLPDDQLGYNSG